MVEEGDGGGSGGGGGGGDQAACFSLLFPFLPVTVPGEGGRPDLIPSPGLPVRPEKPQKGKRRGQKRGCWQEGKGRKATGGKGRKGGREERDIYNGKEGSTK